MPSSGVARNRCTIYSDYSFYVPVKRTLLTNTSNRDADVSVVEVMTEILLNFIWLSNTAVQDSNCCQILVLAFNASMLDKSYNIKSGMKVKTRHNVELLWPFMQFSQTWQRDATVCYAWLNGGLDWRCQLSVS